MQIREHENDTTENGDPKLKLWLNQDEQAATVDRATDSRRELMYRLGFHGLRQVEIVDVTPRDVSRLEHEGREVAVVNVTTAAKDGTRRRVPVSPETAEVADRLASDSGVNQDESLIDRSKSTLRRWIETDREMIAEELRGDNRPRDARKWSHLSLHDLRRTWATDTYYRLAANGSPVALHTTLSWGGWDHTPTGRETFKSDYLGPVPRHITVSQAGTLGITEESTGTRL